MDDTIEGLYVAYRLKDIERMSGVGARKESTAEHVFSTLILAQFFLKKIKGLDEAKVMKMLLYHDMVEIHAGDTFIMDEEGKEGKIEREILAMERLSKELPEEISKDMKELWQEYEKRETMEAKFARAIDALDPMIQCMNDPEKWREGGFTENALRNKKEYLFFPFAEIHLFFNKLIEYLKKKDVLPG